METYWNVKDVAAFVKMSIQTVYRYVENGEIPFHKLNRAVRFKPSEIESWLESRKAEVLQKSTLSVKQKSTDDTLFTEEKTGQAEVADNGVGND